MSAFCQSPYIKASSFKVVHFLVFASTAFSIVSVANRNIAMAMDPSLVTLSPGDTSFGHFLLNFYAIAVFLHFLRIYLTLEMLDECEWLRDLLFGKLSDSKKATEFLIRLLIVLLGSMSLVEILEKWSILHVGDKLWHLPAYLVLLYFVLLLWSVLVLAWNGVFLKRYIFSDLIGFVGSVVLLKFALGDPKELFLRSVVTYAVIAASLCVIIVPDLLSRFFYYTGHAALIFIGAIKGTITHAEAEQKLWPPYFKTQYLNAVKKEREDLTNALEHANPYSWAKMCVSLRRLIGQHGARVAMPDGKSLVGVGNPTGDHDAMRTHQSVSAAKGEGDGQ